MEIEQMRELLDSLEDFFILTPHTEELAKLDILQDIRMNTDGDILPAGLYFMDADSNIYADAGTMDSPLPITVKRLEPIQAATGGQMKIANIIFYIGEYMQMPATANALLDNYFPQDPLQAALQEITLPDEIVQPLDRVTRTFFANKLPPDKEITVRSGTIPGKQNGKRIETVIAPVVTVSLLDLPAGIELSRDIEEMDNAVFTAVCSLFEAGNKRFTGQDIYRVMTGNRNALATPDKLQEINSSWTRLTSTAMKLDTGNMGDAYHFVRWIRNRRIIEGGKERIQLFTGVVIARSGSGTREMFTVRRIVQGEGVERKFPIHSPKIAKIEVVRSSKVRRAKLYFLRDRVGKATRLVERHVETKVVADAAEKAPKKLRGKAKTKARKAAEAAKSE